MANMKELKERALMNAESNQDKKYNVGKEQLSNANTVLSKGMIAERIKDTVNSTSNDKDYDNVWNCFISEENGYYKDFEEYMGYGVSDIEKIGRDKFLATVDWSIKNVHNNQWRKDVVHVVVCGECKNEFTTYQLDFGLCDKCKELFDMDRFYKTLEIMAKSSNPSLAESEAITFSSFSEYRDLYRKFTDEETIDAIIKKKFTDPSSIFLILDIIKEGKEDVIKSLCYHLDLYINENVEARQKHVKLLSLIKDNDIQNIIKLFIDNI